MSSVPGSDASLLAKLGKQQALERRFGFVSLLGFSCTILVTWETVLALFAEALQNGGPAGLIWGFLISWVCSMSVYTCLSEMVSMYPVAGGQYFWVALLAPPSQRRFLGYLTGWLTTLAWIATLAIGVIYVATTIQALAMLNYPEYAAQPWQATLISWGVVLLAFTVNTLLIGALPFLEQFVLAVHFAGFIAVLVVLAVLAPHGDASSVFLTAYNGGGWPTQGISFCVGYIGNVATFIGADAAVHMSEEIEHAALNVPRAIMTTVLFNGAAGFAIAVIALFSLGNVEQALATPTGLPYVQVLGNAAGTKGGTALVAIIIGINWASSTGFLTTSSRMVWSFARDRGLPFADALRLNRTVRVPSARRLFLWKKTLNDEESNAVPLATLVLVSVVPCLLTLIYIGSPVVYNDIISLSVCGLYGSYLVPCACLLWRRVRGDIAPYQHSPGASETEDGSDTIVNEDVDASKTPAEFYGNSASPPSGAGHPERAVKTPTSTATLQPLPIPRPQWGPFRIPEPLGTLNNAFACVYSVFVLFWDFWPPATPVDAATMNYSVLVFGSVLIAAVAWWFLGARGVYVGPLVEVDRGFVDGEGVGKDEGG